jgi:hypothetical protein
VAAHREHTIWLWARVPDHGVLHVIKGKSISSVDVSKTLSSVDVSKTQQEKKEAFNRPQKSASPPHFLPV